MTERPEPTEARSPRISETEMTEMVLPQHANAIGTAFGGTIMSWIDICGAIAAQRHCGRVAVTALVDDLAFLVPIRQGDVVRLTARVNATFRTSLEVEVRVEKEQNHPPDDGPDPVTRVLCADALLTFVAVDAQGRPASVPELRIETDDDRRRAQAARDRRARRLASRQ